ncbi:Poly-beta-1,6-N-acetyl-D-glucosamine export protein precursor [Citrobacter youngae]|nr:Poly-beta-1,6-N-acetyl-D-glucosamine export protein precursor [Citrobacter youngae]
MGALLVRKRTADVIQEYESLSADGEVPNYAKRWVASAWLSERQPEKTEAMLASIYYPNGPIPVTPLSPEDQQDLFYAHIDNENFDAAKKQVDDLIKESPYLRRIYGSPTPQPNDNWLLGQTLLTQYHLAANELPEAEKLSEHLARTGSGNQGLRITYASVLEARGLPHAAEKELKLAEVIEPSNLELERQQAYVALDLQEWKQADELTDDVIARSPDDEATLRLARIRDVHKMSEVRISGTQGISSDSPVSGKNDFNINTAIYSPPINDNWRLFTGFNFATGEFEEGKGISRDLAAGAEWTSRDYWAEMELSGRNYGDGQKMGAVFQPGMTSMITGVWVGQQSVFPAIRHCVRCVAAYMQTAATCMSAGTKTNGESINCRLRPHISRMVTIVSNTDLAEKSVCGRHRASRWTLPRVSAVAPTPKRMCRITTPKVISP